MNNTTDSTHRNETLVLVADAQSARLLLREANGSLQERWTLYAADDRVRGLNQSPDTREVVTTPATVESVKFETKAFVAQIAERLREIPSLLTGAALVIIAPHVFGDELREGLGARLWKHVHHEVPRDESVLSDAALQRLVEQTVSNTQSQT